MILQETALIRICGIEATVGGAPGYFYGVTATDWDRVTKYGLIERVSATHFRLALYEDYTRETLYAASDSVAFAATPDAVVVDPTGDTHLLFGVSQLAPLSEGETIPFTLFGGNEPQAGLRDGCFALITGRTGYDGSTPITAAPENPNTETPVLIWTPGMISKDGLGSPSVEAVISSGGGYDVMSGLSLRLPNSVPRTTTPGAPVQTLTSFLEERSLSFTNDPIYQGTIFDDGVDVTYEPFGLYYGSNPKVNETSIQVPATDPASFIHVQTPKGLLDRQTYHTIPSENAGKPMPLAVGYMLARGIRLSDRTTATRMATVGVNPAYLVRASAFNSGTKTITLFTPGGGFSANDTRLVGKFLGAIVMGNTGGAVFSPKIVSNLATSGALTAITLSDVFRGSDGTAVAPSVGATQNAWWFSAFEVSDFEALSEGPVHSFIGTVMGFSEENQAFFSIADLLLAPYPQGTYAPYPTPAGVLIFPRGPDISTPIQRLGVPPTSPTYSESSFPWTVAPNSGSMGLSNVENTFPANGAAAPVPFDRLLSTNYRNAKTVTTNASSGGNALLNTTALPFPDSDFGRVAAFPIRLPEGFVLGSDEGLSIGCDFDIVLSSRSGGPTTPGAAYIAGLSVTVIDEYGFGLYTSPMQEVAGSGTLVVAAEAGTTFEHRGLGGEYMEDGSPSPWTLVSVDPEDEFLGLLRNKDIAPKLSLVLNFHLRAGCFYTVGAAGSFPFSYKLIEMGLFRTRAEYDGDVFQKIAGVKFGSTWDDRRTATDPVLSVGDAMEYLIRVQDGRPEFIDIDSFNSFHFLRPLPTWFIGHQMLEPENNYDRLNDLARSAFSILYPGKDGKRRPGIIDRYWDPGAHEEPFIEFVPENVVAFGPTEVGMLDRLFTGVDIAYDENPATGDWGNRIRTDHEDEATFPAIDEMTPGSDPAIPVWTSWVSGLNAYDLSGNVVYSGAQYEANYASALALWQKCRAAYLLVGQRRPFKLDLPWFRQAKDWTTGIMSSTEDSAWGLALIVSDYLFVPWVYQPFTIPVTQANAAGIGLMQRVGYGDYIRTDGQKYYALITGIKKDTAAGLFEVTVARRATDTPYDPIGTDSTVLALQDVLDGEASEFQDQNTAAVVWEDQT